MRILLLVHGFNSLSQRLFVELRDEGHVVTVEFDINDDTLREAVELFAPDVILAPFLKRAIPADIWQNHLCLVVHPGVIGDRGPSALDWAILEGEESWGVTVLQAEAEMDAGPIWASASFPMRTACKSSIYRNELTDAALVAVRNAIDGIQTPGFTPRPLDSSASDVTGRLRPAMVQDDRRIDWANDRSGDVMRKIQSSDGVPGVLSGIAGKSVYLHDARPACGMTGEPGEVVATSGPAICVGTKDGAVWIGHARDPKGEATFKLPATRVLTGGLSEVPEVPVDSDHGYREIKYVERGPVGTLQFDFYNGAMSSEQCQRLLAAYERALTRPTKVLVLAGGCDFWSNGIHLNLIEAADNAAEESWRNINAIDDLAEAVIRTESHLTIAAMGGNSGAGGVFLARACDLLWMRGPVIVNPHYKDMGNLYGSEFWTYLLPRHCGEENARRITQQRLPMSAKEALSLGLADAVFAKGKADFDARVARRAEKLASAPELADKLHAKSDQRKEDERKKPLLAYRNEELARMRRNFFGFDTSYHIARYDFVHKTFKSRTPVTLARHRDKSWQQPDRRAS
ncbi:hydrogenase maturation protein [Alisedimentitalea sp. MJ-SS2]|uniref:hydrogenase maturation protein n=1 Tax=Aliisedimentitalea sp. MJ-SS2 TaxID=3049795 RepID=UPI00290B3C69|nr:hydrogenase maturation protein [Alisedimentitalea sp. MJ-SS2]MDU8929659.1 hydrogenase maturation protein [Alisedimentitalea sp. MJ-SS2]